LQKEMTTTTLTTKDDTLSETASFLLNYTEVLETLIGTANAYAAANGIQVETKDVMVASTSTSSGNTATMNIDMESANTNLHSSKTYQMAPMSLLPQAYPKRAFHNALQLAPYFNRLVQCVAQDASFLVQTLGGSVATQDPYTAKLLHLYQHIYHPHSMSSSSSSSADQTDRLTLNPADMATITAFAHSADQLGIIRSDYMLHQNQNHEGSNSYVIKQVELNTIASSFAGLAQKVAQLHKYLIQRYTLTTVGSSETPMNALNQFLLDNQKGMLVASSTAVTSDEHNDDDGESALVRTGTSDTANYGGGVPHNPTLERLPYAMNMAVQRYTERFCATTSTSQNNSGSSSGSPGSQCGILFVVQDGETNTVDQRLLEFQLWELHQIPVVRLSLSQIYTRVQRNMTTGALTVPVSHTTVTQPTMEIALVYYRAGYAPTDYPTENEWKAREMLEGSRATKCPNLGYHLAGTKKVQQELSRPGRLEQYFPNEPLVVNQLRRAFAGLYSLGEDVNDEDMKAVHDIVINRNFHKYVLKPQREGGGYNYYGEQMLTKLLENVIIHEGTQTIELSKALGEYILMERLFPPQQNAILLRAGKVEGIGKTISELGCFGTILVAGKDTTTTTNSDNDRSNGSTSSTNIVHNEYAGFLLRTKFSNVDEGGVASGFATLSSPYLF
jgi:glutathione synthase